MIQRLSRKLSRLIRGKSIIDQPVAEPEASASTPSSLEQLKGILPDASADELRIIQQVQPFTMTSPERILALLQAVEHLEINRIAGDIVECGVWRGGSIAAAAIALQHQRAGHDSTDDRERHLFLYDTFTGMSAPTQADVDCWGATADAQLETQDREDPRSVWCVSQLEEVQQVMDSTRYPENCIHYRVGPVEQTLYNQPLPERIGLLRLDTDWYESTRHELECLYPRLEPGGILIVDDYGHWQGCRQAVDEYFARNGVQMLLHRIDYTGRIGVKLDANNARSAVA